MPKNGARHADRLGIKVSLESAATAGTDRNHTVGSEDFMDNHPPSNQPSAKLAISVNPMAGRDVRRLAARATNMTHEAKRDLVARIAAGADAAGVTDIYVAREPFQIASLALQHMPLTARVHIIDIPLTNTARDTEVALHQFRALGCETVVSLGGDGTNRALVRARQDYDLLPISTGTNNVFPELVEPTIVGIVAGFNARGVLAHSSATPPLKRRAKVLHLETPFGRDIALIDAVQIRDDHVGNLLPFDEARLQRLALTRAEPDAIGMSPIGGYFDPVYAGDDVGLLVDIDSRGQLVNAPLSPGLFKPVGVAGTERMAFEKPVTWVGPGVIALDGDRDHQLKAGETARLTLRRDGPYLIDIDRAMRWLAAAGMMNTVNAEIG